MISENPRYFSLPPSRSLLGLSLIRRLAPAKLTSRTSSTAKYPSVGIAKSSFVLTSTTTKTGLGYTA